METRPVTMNEVLARYNRARPKEGVKITRLGNLGFLIVSKKKKNRRQRKSLDTQ